MKPGEFIVNVNEDGSLPKRASLAIRAALRQLAGHAVAITVEKWRETRSNQANRYYWGVVIDLLCEHTGYTPEEMHDYCKTRFLSKTLAIADGNGEVVDSRVIGGSTAKLNSQQMCEYTDAIRDFAAADLGLLIPDPNPDWRNEEKERAA